MNDLQLTVTSSMRAAAQGVALAHHHYLEHCHIMPKLKGKPDAMAIALGQRKDAHQTYHLALTFLKTATLKANPHYGEIPEPQLQDRLNRWLDQQLNQLIRETADPATNTHETQHRVVSQAEDLRWS